MKSSIEKRYYTITEVSEELDIKPSMLRYWEKEFRQLNPRTNSRGKRFYTRKDIDLIVEIRRLVKEQRYTIDGARKILDGTETETGTGTGTVDVAAVVERLEALRAQLVALKSGAHKEQAFQEKSPEAQPQLF
jgi:DNA-binding transcriptional MerR regulator